MKRSILSFLPNFHLTRKQIITLSLIFIAWRAALFAVGFLAAFVLPYKPSFPYWDIILYGSHLPQWISSWGNFDGVHYLSIADHGYTDRIGFVQAFFPFFPLLILHTARIIFGDHWNSLLFALVVTNVAAYLAVLVWFALVKQHWNERMAWIAVAVLLLFPTSFYLGAIYTESIFLFATFFAFFAARQQKWGAVLIAVLIATSTRVVGIFLVPALFIEVWEQGKMPLQPKKLVALIRKQWHAFVLISLGSFGLLAYMSYLYLAEFHDPLYFLHVQSGFGSGRQESLVIYPQVVWRSIKILLTSRPFDVRYYASVQEAIAGIAGLVGLLFAYKKTRLSWLFFAFCAFFLPPLTGTFSSMPRYILVCFPLFLFITFFIQKRSWTMVFLMSLSAIWLIWNTILFIQGYWVA